MSKKKTPLLHNEWQKLSDFSWPSIYNLFPKHVLAFAYLWNDIATEYTVDLYNDLADFDDVHWNNINKEYSHTYKYFRIVGPKIEPPIECSRMDSVSLIDYLTEMYDNNYDPSDFQIEFKKFIDKL